MDTGRTGHPLTPLVRIRYLIVVFGLSCWLGISLAEETMECLTVISISGRFRVTLEAL